MSQQQASFVTQEPQTTQSKPTADRLTRILAEWKDLAVAVILVGKLESLLTQSIAYDIYTHWKRDAESIVWDIGQFQREVLNDAGYSKNECDAEYPTQLAELLKGVLEEIKKPRTTTPYTFSEKIRDDFLWFENLETREIIAKGSCQPSELEKLALGLMYEWVYIICDGRYEWIIAAVPNKFLKELKADLNIDDFKKIRNWIVHLSPYHSFSSPNKRKEFLEYYKTVTERFIKEKNCFCLPTDQKEEKFQKYMQPKEDFETLVKILETYAIVIKERKREAETTRPEEKEELLKQIENLKKEKNQYKKFVSEVEKALDSITKKTESARAHIQKLENPSLKEEEKMIFKSLKDDLDDIDREMKNLGGFNKEPQEAADSEGEGDEEADAAETGTAGANDEEDFK